MLSSLEIRNFKNLKDLRINSLSRINLFTGKNNTGKSTILEALAIYATKGDLNVIYQLLNERGENHKQSDSDKNETETNIKALSSLFTDRQINFNQQESILLTTTENTLFDKQAFEKKNLSVRFVKYHDELVNSIENHPNQGVRRKIMLFDDNDLDNLLDEYKIGLEIHIGNNAYILPLDRARPYRFDSRSFLGNLGNYQLIRTHNIDREVNGNLWDNITLSEKEYFVVDALKIIEPDIERIAFIEQGTKAVIKLNNSNNIFPLRSMGDGINRVLTIILALVNSDNGFLLIDEFENGLHYTVQKKLWEIIFNLSEALDVQVFATTHSEDCISAFGKVLSNAQNQSAGKLIRLDSKNGSIRQVEYSAHELKIAIEQDIETR